MTETFWFERLDEGESEMWKNVMTEVLREGGRRRPRQESVLQILEKKILGP